MVKFNDQPKVEFQVDLSAGSTESLDLLFRTTCDNAMEVAAAIAANDRAPRTDTLMLTSTVVLRGALTMAYAALNQKIGVERELTPEIINDCMRLIIKRLGQGI